MLFQDWVSTVDQLIQQMYDIDFGYPLGLNRILPPQSPGIVAKVFEHANLRSDGMLQEFYACCDGVSIPDVHVGYFIKPVSKLITVDPESEPIEITGASAGKVLSIGSTGGGGLFVLRCQILDVLYLPPGPLHSGVYDGTQTKVKVVASNFVSFLDTLKDDLEAFVHNTPNHRFIV